MDLLGSSARHIETQRGARARCLGAAGVAGGAWGGGAGRSVL